jgi:hypothetical protein
MTATISFEQYREQWLDDVREGQPSTSELGHRFARKLLTQWLEIDDASDDLVYCDGSGDGGIDIAYLHRGSEAAAEDDEGAEGDTWYLVQSKYGKAFAGGATLLQEATKVLETLTGHRSHLSSLAEGLLARLTTFRSQASEQDRLTLVFATQDPLDEAQRRILDDIRAMGRERLGAIFDVETVSVETIYTRTLEEEQTGALATIRVPLKGEFSASGDDLLVGAVSLVDLYDFLKSYRTETGDLDQLYERNVRRFLGSRGKVNRAMHQTLQTTPERFGLYNNGITVVVADFAQEDGHVTLAEPYIVNGCQTTRTIWEICHQRLEAGGTGTNPDQEKWRQDARRGVVVVKVVRVGTDGEVLLQDITPLHKQPERHPGEGRPRPPVRLSHVGTQDGGRP